MTDWEKFYINLQNQVVAAVNQLIALIGNCVTDTLTSIAAKIGNNARSLYAMLGTRWDSASSLGADIATILSKLQATFATNTYTNTNDVNENVVIEFAAAKQDIDLTLYTYNLTQVTTFREYEKDLAGNYQEISAKAYPTEFSTGATAFCISKRQLNAAYKITMQAQVLEGATRDVPYRYATQDIS